MATDRLKVGDKLDELHFTVTPEFNTQILESVHCSNSVYQKIVHPSLLVGLSNITKSPSFKLDYNVAAVHVQDEIEFIRPAVINDTLTISWIIESIYKRKNRNWDEMEYQIAEATISGSDNEVLIKRRMTDYFSRGKKDV